MGRSRDVGPGKGWPEECAKEEGAGAKPVGGESWELDRDDEIQEGASLAGLERGAYQRTGIEGETALYQPDGSKTEVRAPAAWACD